MRRHADLVDVSGATDIHNTKFDDPSNPIANNGTLNKDIIPAKYVSFVDYLNSTQLARFGLHNGEWAWANRQLRCITEVCGQVIPRTRC